MGDKEDKEFALEWLDTLRSGESKLGKETSDE